VATLYLKLMQAYDKTHFKDEDGHPFIAEQFTKDYVVKVDAHSQFAYLHRGFAPVSV
jgi:hypothetical protein